MWIRTHTHTYTWCVCVCGHTRLYCWYMGLFRACLRFICGYIGLFCALVGLCSALELRHLNKEEGVWSLLFRTHRALLWINRISLQIYRAHLRTRRALLSPWAPAPKEGGRCVHLQGLFCGYVGLFCGYVGLFCGYVGLFFGFVGLFCGYVGLFCGYIGLSFAD